MNKPANIDPARQSYLRQYELVDLVREYDPSVDEALLNKAYVFATQAHGDQMRHSGDPYYAHPIEVAGILATLKLDTASVCTALLHDVLEDTDVTYAQMEEMFGAEIAELVNGVTKLGQVELSGPNRTREQKQAENFQKFVLAMSRDVRVLLVKLCDRLHNMRTLQHHPKQASRERIARETLEIYAPLARRIGVDRICSELEDLSFRHINPSAFESITKRLEAWRADQKAAISQMSVALRDLMDEKGVTARIYGREKRAYAIWRKLQRQGISFEDVSDIYAFRMIVENRSDCYEMLGILHQAFRCVPARFRDFISVPKPNGYQSLHTTILGPENKRLEIQIRTERMEDVAERGVAAHWAYKNESYAFDPEIAKDSGGGDPLSRIRPFVEMMEQSGDADEFLEHAKLEMFADQVFTFTPKGDLISLPRGATSIDFAYAVHTMVGDTCIGASINGRDRPLRTELANGDVVRIVRGGTPEPQAGWQNMVATGKARSALRRLTRDGEQAEYRRIGSMLAEHAFAREDKDFAETVLEDTLKRLNMTEVDELFESLGRGDLSIQMFMNAVFPGRENTEDLDTYQHRDLIDDSTAKLYIKGEGMTPGQGLHLSECCSPIPGDRIVGIQRVGKGIDLHTIDCEILGTLDEPDGNWLDLGWRRAAKQSASIARVTVTVEHVPGALADVTKNIGEANGNLTNIKTVKRSPSFFDMVLDVEVTDNRHLSQIIAALRASAYVVSAKRTRAERT
ncbi:MAG: RelA/SpoT family protein [Maricaulaceae bacterium]